ncbi:MAG: heme ABC exporter ATP-binding protein CcmA [Hyphomicrobium sp.]
MPIRQSSVFITVQLFAEQLVIARGERTVIDRLSFSVSSGEALILTGPNGSGKTTLLRALAGFLPLESGTIRLDGGADVPIGEQAHVVGHANAVQANLTVGENIRFWAEYLGGSDAAEQRAAAALAYFGLDALADFYGAELSAGQKRRLGLARVLASHRPIWLLDEPTVSLDTAANELVSKAVDAHTANGGLVIAATHLPLGLARTRELRLGALEQAA